jgi:hypothetical protein
MRESEFIEILLQQNRDTLAEIPKKWAQAKRDLEREIDDLISSAGIMHEVQRLRDQLEANQKALQSQADKLQGQNALLETLHTKFHLAPIPDGVTHMYGIELAPLDPETRLRVMGGQNGPSWAETITVLGGDPERPEWDGAEDADYSEEDFSEDDFSEEDFSEDDFSEDDAKKILDVLEGDDISEDELRQALADNPDLPPRELAERWLKAREVREKASDD